ncbi:(S)-2-hydroxy-acid oxidase [Pseudonocardia dioxanivorans CB1190]|uniref:(S)-2-hydroxy-acid oxidase n=1 Tax=Pseudonocardia dioxanivorans (strain ATCC 55486 / DSM 44775 / JCM 13855 / CB1190) TaxID=675635 RepID=F4CZ97_PSEUX|nr:alpha-hydroxy acid oxidase [Pseudonocardia dioxanivorans]AEA24801.1 (S)-2-hydroxy-acid oxidase [Pseudonocardia dioxanivorans CB1190]
MVGSARRGRLASAVTVADLRAAARRRLPRMVFDFVDGGAEDELTLTENEAAFDRVSFRPRVLVDVSERPQHVTVLGRRLELPVILGPTGLMRMVDHEGERASAAAAHAFGTVSVTSSGSSVSIEDVAASVASPQWFQLYPWGDRGTVENIIGRARDSGFEAMVVTVDVPVVGAREKDLRNGLTVPPQVNPRTGWDLLRHPGWLAGLLTHPRPTFANFTGLMTEAKGTTGLAVYTNGLLNPAHTWRDLEWMVERWGGPVVLKGVMTGEDAKRAVDVGCRAVAVSNHGGRQGDSVPAALDVLPEVVDAVPADVDVLLDGGVRRGGDVVKALALGARACLLGRPWVYGLAAGGTAGVERMLAILRDEIDRTLALIGRPGVATLDCSAVGPWPRAVAGGLADGVPEPVRKS